MGVGVFKLAAAAHQHGWAKIHGRNRSRGVAAANGQRNIKRARGQIKYAACVAQTHVLRQHFAPVLVKAKAQHAVEQIVKRHNAAKHASYCGIVSGLGGGLCGGVA